MKKKLIMMIASTLIALLVLTPIAHAEVVHFWWDNIYFVDGTDIDYAHPDNAYYGISPSSDWTILGNDLHHHQINRGTTTWIVIGTVIFVEVLQLLIAIKLGGGVPAQIVGGLAGIVLASFIGVILDEYFVDERGCMWLWIGSIFMAYLLENLAYLSGINQELALATILAAFTYYGYFRIGKVTFHDPLGIGEPSPPPPPPPPPQGGSGCPILSVWNGTDYFEEGLLNIHNPDGVDVIYEHTLVSTPQRVHGAYLFRLVEHPQTHSYIDQVKLYAVLEDETMQELPLIYARHSEDGNVLPQLLFSDERKTETLGSDHNDGTSQSIDLKFASLSPNLETTGFMFQIEGNNMIYKMKD